MKVKYGIVTGDGDVYYKVKPVVEKLGFELVPGDLGECQSAINNTLYNNDRVHSWLGEMLGKHMNNGLQGILVDIDIHEVLRNCRVHVADLFPFIEKVGGDNLDVLALSYRSFGYEDEVPEDVKILHMPVFEKCFEKYLLGED